MAIYKKIYTKLMAGLLVTGFLATQVDKCAALPEEAEIPAAEQEALNAQLLLWHSAAEKVSHVQAMLERGADPNAMDRWGWTPLMRTASNGNVAVTKCLILAGAHLNTQQPHSGKSALMLAIPEFGDDSQVVQQKLGAMETLIRARADLNIQDNEKNTALINAVDGGIHWYAAPCVALLLVRAGADDTIRNDQQKTISDLLTSDPIYEYIKQALATQNTPRPQVRQKAETRLRPARDYLLNGPLSIDPLTNIFVHYAIIDNPIEAAKQWAIDAEYTQNRQAQKTRAKALLWRAQQAAAKK
jgi:ankyrin repeat protein